DARERHAGGIAGGGVHLACSACQRLACEGQSEAAVGAGDQDGGIGKSHEVLLVRCDPKYDVHHIVDRERWRCASQRMVKNYSVSYCASRALRAAARRDLPFALTPSVRASCRLPTIVLA